MPESDTLKPHALIAASIILASLIIAGSILYTGGHASGTVATTDAPAAAADDTKPADISKVKIDGEPYYGKADAPVTIAYWSDYQCPFCQRHEQQVVTEIIKNYVDTGKAKIVFKDFAFLGADSQTLAKYAHAVWETAPDKFYAWHKAIFDNQGQENTGWATKERIEAISTPVIGAANMAKVENLVATKGDEYQKAMDADKAEGASMGIQGTPGTVIGKTLIPGAYPYDTFKNAIEAVLK
jgi:protein-disulfide isomerase